MAPTLRHPVCQPFNNQTFTHKYLDLLSAIPNSLGYRSLTQTHIDKFYMPRALGDQAQLSLETQTEWLRVFKGNPNHAAGRWRSTSPFGSA